MRGELDWIVMKAIDKERSRRYETPNAFADDIQRYLNQEAIIARPASTAYRLKKFTQRNWPAVFAGSAIAAALLLGTFVSTWMAVREYQASQVALSKAIEANEQRSSAMNAKQDADHQRQAAEGLNEELATSNKELQQQSEDLRRRKETQRRLAYAGQMNAIQKAWDANNIARVRELLNATRPGRGEEDLRGFEWHYWQRQIHHDERACQLPVELKAFAIDEDIAFSQDARLFAKFEISGATSRVRVWNARTSNQVLDREITFEPTNDEEFETADNGVWVELASIVHFDADHIAIVWMKRQVILSDGGPSPLPRIARLKLLSLETGEDFANFKTTVRWNTIPFSFSRDAMRVAVTLNEPYVQILDVTSGSEIARIPIPSVVGANRVTEYFALSRDGTHLAIKPGVLANTGVEPAGITIVNIESKQQVTTDSVFAQGLEFSNDGKRIAALGGEHVTLFETTTGKKLNLIAGIKNQDSMEYSPNGQWLAFAYSSAGAAKVGSIEIINSATGEPAPKFKGYTSNPVRVAFSKDGTTVYSAHENGQILSWPAPDSSIKIVRTSLPLNDTVFSNDGRWIARLSASKWSDAKDESIVLRPTSSKIILEDTTGQVPTNYMASIGEKPGLKFSPAGDYLVAVMVDKKAELQFATQVAVWEAETGRQVLKLQTRVTETARQGVRPSDIAFSRDSQRLAVVMWESGKANVRMWNIPSGKEIIPDEGIIPVKLFPRIKFIGAGELLLSRSTTSTGFQVWDTRSGKLTCENSDSTSAISSLDGSHIAGIVKHEVEARVVVWESRTGREISSFAWEDGKPLSQVALSQDGTRTLLASDQSIKVFDTSNGLELSELQGNVDVVCGMAFAPDGKRIVTLNGVAQESKEPLVGGGYTPGSRNVIREAKILDAASGLELLSLPVPIRHSDPGAVKVDITSDVLSLAPDLTWDGSRISTNRSVEELVLAAQEILSKPVQSNESVNHALSYLEQACVDSPSHIHAWRLRAVAHFRLKQKAELERAVAQLKKLNESKEQRLLAEDLTLEAVANHFLDKRQDALTALDQARVTPSQNEAFWQKMLLEVESLMEAPRAADDPAAWNGREVMPRIARNLQVAFPLRVTKIEGDRLWVDGDWISRTEVVSIDHAVDYYTQILAMNPKYNYTYHNYRAIAQEHAGEFDKAIEDYSAAARLSPRDGGYHYNRGLLYAFELRDLERGLADFEEARRLFASRYPDLDAARCKVLRLLGRQDEAMESIDAAIKRLPDRGRFLSTRAYVHAAMDNSEAMRRDLQKGIQTSPEDERVWQLRAWLLATSPNTDHRDGKQAITDATKACGLTFWKDAVNLACLGAAFAEAGDFAQAVKWQEKAIELSPPAKRPMLEDRLKLYRDGKPYREPPVQ